jgi:hypothetical protein
MVVEPLASPASSGMDLMNPATRQAGGLAHIFSKAAVEPF